MSHTHGADDAPEHSHGGSARGLGWDLLDSIMLGCAAIVACILAELLYKQWQASRVRYDLTPEGRAATSRHTCSTTTTEALCQQCKAEGSAWHRAHPDGVPLVDLDALSEAVKRGDLGTDQQ